MPDFEFSANISESIKEEILNQLRHIEKDNGVKIIFAIESGSRAWGFPSPDSDYDVRFVYAHSIDWYLSLQPQRDVIEIPIDEELDINGWDIRKALNLLLKPNPVMLEWLSSPIKYQWNGEVCQKLITLSQNIAHGPACLHHYLNLGSRQWSVYIDGNQRVNLKKYFYIVRPAMAIRWMRLHPDTIPPMNFQALSEGCDLSAELSAELKQLLIAKSKSKELGKSSRVKVIDDFIEEEFSWAREAVKTVDRSKAHQYDEANALFQDIIRSL